MFKSPQCLSRIGQQLLKYPLDVQINIENGLATVIGNRGQLSLPLMNFIKIDLNNTDNEASKHSLQVSV
jgi:ribosomal protein L6P/L9E